MDIEIEELLAQYDAEIGRLSRRAILAETRERVAMAKLAELEGKHADAGEEGEG